MNEIERVVSYIKSCREAGIDCTVTIDKSKTHIILNALENRCRRIASNLKAVYAVRFVRKRWSSRDIVNVDS